MSTFLCKNGVRKEYFLTPTFIIEPEFIDAGRIVKVPLDLSPILRKTHLVYHPQRVRGLAALKAIEFITNPATF